MALSNSSSRWAIWNGEECWRSSRNARPAAVLGRYRTLTADADRIVSPRVERQDLLDAHVVLPAVSEVVLVQQALADAHAKCGQAHVSGIVTEAVPPSCQTPYSRPLK